ncbi:hypothetical protein R3P38DRAFT_2850331 [Favolaschia claudopus]|uniref:Uncharacterized protein n=1 Tax=Favolaschia claudopus TaxID=2862362 RepID=A0AAW0DYR9_9AGAR
MHEDTPMSSSPTASHAPMSSSPTANHAPVSSSATPQQTRINFVTDPPQLYRFPAPSTRRNSASSSPQRPQAHSSTAHPPRTPTRRRVADGPAEDAARYQAKNHYVAQETYEAQMDGMRQEMAKMRELFQNSVNHNRFLEDHLQRLTSENAAAYGAEQASGQGSHQEQEVPMDLVNQNPAAQQAGAQSSSLATEGRTTGTATRDTAAEEEILRQRKLIEEYKAELATMRAREAVHKATQAASGSVPKKTRRRKKTPVTPGTSSHAAPAPAAGRDSDDDTTDEDEDDDEVDGVEKLLREDPKVQVLIAKIVSQIMKTAVKGRLRPGLGENSIARRPSARSQAIQKQKVHISKKKDLMWKAVIRDLWRTQYGRKRAVDFQHYTPVDVEEVQLCNQGIKGPLPQEYALDFSEGYNTSIWNATIIQKLAARVKAAHEDDWQLPKVSDEYIAAHLYGHLKRSQEQWKRRQPRFLPEKQALETNLEVILRCKDSVKREAERAVSRSLKQQKLTLRKKTTADRLLLATPGTEEHSDLEYDDDLLDYLGVDGMSSEDDDTLVVPGGVVPSECFKVKKCIWRAEPVTYSMNDIDRHAALHKKNNNRGGAKKGTRVRVEELGKSEAPSGLPRALYDEDWVASKEREIPLWVEQRLCINDKAIFKLRNPKGKGRAI